MNKFSDNFLGNHVNGINGNVFKYYLILALLSLTFFTPVYILFLQNNGMSLTQVMVLEAMYSLVMVIFLIPSGAFADLVGRKWVIVAGIIAEIFAIISYAFGTGFWSFAVAEVLWGIGTALIMSIDSILYDSLKSIRKEEEAKQVFSNGFFFTLFFIVIGSSLSGFIAAIDMKLTFLLTIIPWAAALVVALWFIEPSVYKKKKFNLTGYFSQMNNAINEIKRKDVLLVIIASGLITGFSTINYSLIQPYLKASGIPLAFFGIFFAIYSLTAALSSKLLNKIGTGWPAGKFIIYGAVLLGISYLIRGFVFDPVGAVFSSLLTAVLMGILVPNFLTLVHKAISSQRRATISSINIMLSSMIAGILGPFFGILADWSLSAVFIALAICVAVSISSLCYLMPRRCSARKI